MSLANVTRTSPIAACHVSRPHNLHVSRTLFTAAARPWLCCRCGANPDAPLLLHLATCSQYDLIERYDSSGTTFVAASYAATSRSLISFGTSSPSELTLSSAPFSDRSFA